MKTIMNKNHVSIGIAGLAYKLPATKKVVEDLGKQHLLHSKASLLGDFGFQNCYAHEPLQRFEDLLLESSKEALQESGSQSKDITRIFLYSGINREIDSSKQKNALELFRYPVAELRHKLGLTNANAIALSQQGCSGLLSVIDLARQLLVASKRYNEAMLCVTGDLLPKWVKREIMYNIMSDAAAALVIVKNCEKNRIVSFHQEIQSYYWDTPVHENELLASYFPLAQRAIENAIKEAGLTISDIKWFVPHNVSLRSWQILAKLLNIPMEKVWTENIARVGHSVSCDHIINLVDMTRKGKLKKGDYLVLFTFGFGASWSCLILQH
jgi:3-oxoacyl-[acyl-carrier-protein] synthase III